MISVLYANARSSELNLLDEYKKGSWLHAVEPSEDEQVEIAQRLGLEADLLHDALDLYESPRVEVDDGVVYIFTRYFYADNDVINATEPVLFVYHPDALVTVLRVASGMFKDKMVAANGVITTQKTKLLLEMFFEVNDSYQKYMNRTTRYILKVRSQLKRTDISSDALLELVEIEDDLNEILSALQPHAVLLRSILGGKYIRLYEEDRDLVEDLSLNTNELIELVKSRLKTLVNIRQAYEALSTADLNRTFKRLTSISIFMAIPTISAGVYGMNVILPFQESEYAFWYILLIITGIVLSVIFIFNKKRWL